MVFNKKQCFIFIVLCPSVIVILTHEKVILAKTGPLHGLCNYFLCLKSVWLLIKKAMNHLICKAHELSPLLS
ncbi:MAG: hypothetical protein CR997_07910 [Acidobacteria bacterium]|nr:MAG: hypothetical protein CR997_07910 [Acidobacteriota bacterium]